MPRGIPAARPPGAPRAPGGGRRPTGSRIDLRDHPDALHALPLLAALRLGRPISSKAEIAACVAELIEAERQRVLATPVDTEQRARLLARLAELEQTSDE